MDTSLKPETEEDKLGILDIKVKTKTGKIIDIEIQVNPARSIGNRLSFYKSKLIVEQIAKGEHYRIIEKVICVCITDYELFPRERDYLNRFRFYNPKNGLCFIEMVAVKNPEIRKAVDTLYELSADERTRAEYEMHMRAVRDRAWLKDEGLRKGRMEGWQELLTLIKSGKNPDEAMTILNEGNGE